MKKLRLKFNKKIFKKIMLSLLCIALIAAVTVSSVFYFGGKFDESSSFLCSSSRFHNVTLLMVR